jgi:hypothetical protein
MLKNAGWLRKIRHFGCNQAENRNPSQKYLKFPDQTAWVSLSVGYPRMVATRPVSSSE